MKDKKKKIQYRYPEIVKTGFRLTRDFSCNLKVLKMTHGPFTDREWFMWCVDGVGQHFVPLDVKTDKFLSKKIVDFLDFDYFMYYHPMNASLSGVEQFMRLEQMGYMRSPKPIPYEKEWIQPVPTVKTRRKR